MNKKTIPAFIEKYFWGDDLSQLNPDKNKKYIIETLLEKGDREAVRWLFSYFDKKTILNYLPEIRLTKRSANFWNIYFQKI